MGNSQAKSKPGKGHMEEKAPEEEKVIEIERLSDDCSNFMIDSAESTPMAKYVIAIDMGTSRSAHAVFYTSTGMINVVPPRNFVIPEDTADSIKVETCILFPKGAMKAIMYGNKAKELYFNNPETYIMFTNFKLSILDVECNDSKNTVKDYSGKFDLELRVIVSETLRLLSESIFESIADSSLKREEIEWVITIPGMFNEAASGFMRTCACDANIITYQLSPKLTICYESEAATVDLLNYAEKQNVHFNFREHRNICVLDSGAGTTDISVHTINSVAPFRSQQLISPYGIQIGAGMLDTQLFKLLYDLDPIWFENVRLKPDFLSLLLQWEGYKRAFKHQSSDSIFKVDLKLLNDDSFSSSQLKQKISDYNTKHASGSDDYLTCKSLVINIPGSLVKKWFDSVIDQILANFHATLSDPTCNEVSVIYLAGGFCANYYMQFKLRQFLDTFTRRIALVAPASPELAIVRGAALSYHMKRVTKLRMKRSYGIEYIVPFNQDLHEGLPITRSHGKSEVVLVHRLVKSNYMVDMNFRCDPIFCVPSNKSNDSYYIRLFCVENDANPEQLCPVNSASLVTKITIPIDITQPSNERLISVSIEFSNEIKFHVYKYQNGQDTLCHESTAQYYAPK